MALQFNDPQDDKLKEFFEGEGKPEKGTEIEGFGPEEPENPPKPEKKNELPQDPPKEEPTKEEPKKEEDKSTVVGKTGEGDEGGGEQGPPQEPKKKEWEFNLEAFNNTFETEYDSEDSFKEDLTAAKELKEKNSELEGQLAGLTEKYEAAKKAVNPKQYFANEEEEKRQKILIKYGRVVNPAALNMLVSTDFDKLSDFDTVVLAEMINNPGIRGGEAGARELIYDELGIDPDSPQSEWDTLTQNKIARNAAKLRVELSKLQEVDEWDIPNFEGETKAQTEQAEKAKQELTGQWSAITDKFLDGLDEIKYTGHVDGKESDLISYAVPKEFKAEVRDDVISFMVEEDMAPTPENINNAIEYVKERFLINNFVDILLAQRKDVETRVAEEKDKQHVNPKPQEDRQKPEGAPEDENAVFYEKVRLKEKLPDEGAPLFGKG